MDDDLFQYLAEIMPDAIADCDGCPEKFVIGKGFEKDGKIYHNRACWMKFTAPIVKPTGQSLKVTDSKGRTWDV